MERSAKSLDGKTTYSEGVLIGYRLFDAQNVEPLFPFGFRLSYTHFAYDQPHAVADTDGGAPMSVKVTNTGTVAGEEVPQVYLDAPTDKPAGVQFAPRVLATFRRVALRPGESRVVEMKIAPWAFEFW